MKKQARVLILVLFVTCGGPTCGGAGSVALWLLLPQLNYQQNQYHHHTHTI